MSCDLAEISFLTWWKVPQHVAALCNVPQAVTTTSPWGSATPLTPSAHRLGLNVRRYLDTTSSRARHTSDPLDWICRREQSA